MHLQGLMNSLSLWILPVILIVILTVGLIKKVPIYEAFTDGAKDGFNVAVNIIPYLVAILVSISMLRASGAIDMCGNLLSEILTKLSIPVDVLPLMIVRSLSGSAALGVFSDIANNFGPDAYATKLAAVKIAKVRYALLTGLIADFIGILVAVVVAHQFFL